LEYTRQKADGEGWFGRDTLPTPPVLARQIAIGPRCTSGPCHL